MTYKPLTGSRGEELLTLYLAGFHAKTSPQLEGEKELTENGQECGEKWHASFTKYDPNSFSWKTHQCSLLGDLDEFSETWPRWGLMRGGECWEQQTLEQTIRGTEFGLSEMWPTPATKGYGHAAEGMVSNLIQKIENGVISKEEAEAMLSLPKLENHRTWKKKFPTPCQRDYKGKTISGERVTKSGKTQKYGDTLPNVVGGKLNPTWVEWLMGWPLGWTDLKPLETDKFQKWLDAHGKS
jgi:DNA (cytosine-5)-methyltransferase 1